MAHRGFALAWGVVWLVGWPAPLPAQQDQAPPEESTTAADRLGLAVDPGAPMTIEADELEAAQTEGGRDRVIFRSRVRVEQGEMILHCDWLEAIYPPREQGGSGQPRRITARGDVRIEQGGNVAHCNEAIFNNQACSAECTATEGRARLSRGDDVISADRIFFDLCEGILKARGRVLIETRPAEADE